MIEFKITQCPEKLQQGVYLHFDAGISFGNLEASMIIDDPNMAAKHARVYFEGAQPMVQNISDDTDMRLNANIIAPGDSSPLKIRDNLSLGKTVVQFTQLSLEPPKTPQAYTHPHADMRFAEGTKESAILKALEVLSGSTENKTEAPVSPPPPPKPPMPPPLPKKHLK